MTPKSQRLDSSVFKQIGQRIVACMFYENYKQKSHMALQAYEVM